jgi:hypothetical protein
MAALATRGPGPLSQRWVTTRGTISAIAAEDAEIANAVFGRSAAIALGGWPGSTHGRSWGSQAQFAADVQAGAIPETVRAVMYDPEAWEATPLPERQDPIRHIREFVRLAHQQGYFAIVTPHLGLVEVADGRFGRRQGETREEAYLRHGIAAEAARHADAYETQGQHLQRDPTRYREFVRRTAEQARAANPGIVMLSGLATHPGYPATPEMLRASWEVVRDVVDGHYLSLSRRRLPSVAGRFLRMIAESAGHPG